MGFPPSQAVAESTFRKSLGALRLPNHGLSQESAGKKMDRKTNPWLNEKRVVEPHRIRGNGIVYLHEWLKFNGVG